MPKQPFTPFQVRVQERKAKQQGIDFRLAYRALIRGFVRAKTKLLEDEQEKRKVQDGCKTHL
jgi:hypothetical protein